MAGLLDPSQGDGTYVENRPSKWAQTWGILGPYITDPFTGAINWTRDMMNADPYTLLADTGPRAQALAQGGAEVATNVMGASSVVPKPDDAINMGFRVFHGSPHDFPPVRLIEMPDGRRLYQNMSELAETPQGARIIKEYPMGRFDLSKIGTGEGAQAYGHGLYFAESEGVAKSYRDALSSQKIVDADGDVIGETSLLNPKTSNGPLAKAPTKLPQNLSEADSVAVLMMNGWDRDASVKWLTSRGVHPNVAQSRVDTTLNFYDPDTVSIDKGRMYEVEIDADPNAFLDWDKPLSEQPEAVRRLAGWTPEAEAQYRSAQSSDTDALLAALEGDAQYSPAKMPRPPEAIVPFSASGDELHQRMFHQARRELGGEGGAGVYQARVAEKLREAGIPGIRYLDAGSRSAGEGSRNYVVFDDNLINIIRKYGIAGLLGGSAAMDAMMSEQQNTQ